MVSQSRFGSGLSRIDTGSVVNRGYPKFLILNYNLTNMSLQNNKENKLLFILQNTYTLSSLSYTQ